MDEENWAGRESDNKCRKIHFCFHFVKRMFPATWSKEGAQDGGPDEHPTQLQATLRKKAMMKLDSGYFQLPVHKRRRGNSSLRRLGCPR